MDGSHGTHEHESYRNNDMRMRNKTLQHMLLEMILPCIKPNDTTIGSQHVQAGKSGSLGTGSAPKAYELVAMLAQSRGHLVPRTGQSSWGTHCK